MLSQIPEMLTCPEAEGAADMLLGHWNDRKKKKYFLFGIGTDFAKPKAPLIWYDIVHFVDTLTSFVSVRKDKRMGEIMELLTSIADDEGRLTSKSIWTKWK
jgi:hypothetical protein